MLVRQHLNSFSDRIAAHLELLSQNELVGELWGPTPSRGRAGGDGREGASAGHLASGSGDGDQPIWPCRRADAEDANRL